MVTLGTGAYTYEVTENWAKLPDGWSFKEVAAVAVDAHDNVYAFNRGEHPMMIFDRDGNFLRSWGEGIFPRAHGLTLAPDDTLFCTDDGDHTVRKCTLDGKVLFTLGISGKPAPFMSGNPFNRCTHVAIDPRNGDFYVSDGYGNARVHKYAPEGKLLFSWGESGTDPGQFNIAHNIATDKDGWVYVADRENHRIQVFDANGKFETQWVNMARPSGLYIDQASDTTYIGEIGAAIGANAEARQLGSRVSIYNTKGELLARLGDQPPGEAPGQFISPHGISIDSHGDIYVGEVSWTNTGQHLDPPRELRSLQKLVRKS
ncbi:peptidyl-alpha-hydroxyglycine alpha-amidating lyase family protein [Candidatus Entotheonella palauensis]|uniref:peptidyl-alpha-hydroxyglycine alpha-amidating lyase family protein n=1 Tax=Candidatus Entotheonella palauensis TaxID=93172 RepID=UPI000B7DD89E|nr:peptidyl-alpha-hydroxyglycine alpha-amidating lyase family protein [Candidatus Entotheonella palauensis]